MNENEQIRGILVKLREKAGLSQAQLAERLQFNASRVSRLESGGTELTLEDAELIASGIASEESKAFADYLRSEWKILERPGFNHVSLASLWKAEEALQRVAELESDPDLKNAFVQQIRSCRQALERAANALRSTEHPISLIGAPGVGKTTVICTLAQLRKGDWDSDLDKQMALQTGGGRQTLCEVHVRNGGEFNISVEACTPEELQQYVGEFCDDLLAELNPDKGGSREGPGLSAEVDRAIRNMTGLTVKRSKDADGKIVRDDRALDLAKQFPKKEDLMVQVLLKLDLPRRNRTSISFPRESTMAGLEWVSKTFAEVNYGRHPEFSLPRRIEITVPKRVLNTDEFDLRLIDTRGVDEPTAPRRDLQAYLDDPRAAIVLCSGFNDAPEAAVQAVIERAVEGGLQQELIKRGVLLVLPGGDEDCTLRDPVTGERVANAKEGREIRREQIAPTLHPFGVRHLPVVFADVRSPEDCEELRRALVSKIKEIRQRQEKEIESLSATIDRLIANRKDAETRAVFEAATKDLRNWFASHATLPPADMEVQSALIEEMDGLRYASSLRASVNRRGNWHNFDYWHGLGFGTRREAVARAAKQVEELKVLIAAVLRDDQLSPAHDFIKHFANELEKSVSDYYQWTQSLGEGAFQNQLGEDFDYWKRCQDRWGGGPGYKTEIRQWTSRWFDADASKQRSEFVETELQRQWKELFQQLNAQLSSADPEASAVAN
ncbi:MAG TPA: helix-turn-helix transcriptional regulator [Verrucomicrobiae bacterium]|nr:helix-turn-helix transcriptional regulator [Verrucomicrobiae bacterium]